MSNHLKLFSNVGFHEVIYENNTGNDILFNRYKIIIDNLVVLSGEIDEKIKEKLKELSEPTEKSDELQSKGAPNKGSLLFREICISFNEEMNWLNW